MTFDARDMLFTSPCGINEVKLFRKAFFFYVLILICFGWNVNVAIWLEMALIDWLAIWFILIIERSRFHFFSFVLPHSVFREVMNKTQKKLGAVY